MTTYCKICIICSKKFYCVKISTAMCSRKCRNRARYLPKQLLANLIKRNSNFDMVANEYTASVLGRDNTVTTMGEIRHATAENPLGDELAPLIAFAKEEAKKRGVTPPRNLKEQDFKLTSKISFTPHIDDTLPDPDDDGLGVVNEIAKQQQQAKPTFGVDHKDIDKQNDKVNLSSVVPQTNENDLSLSNIRRGIRKLGGSK